MDPPYVSYYNIPITEPPRVSYLQYQDLTSTYIQLDTQQNKFSPSDPPTVKPTPGKIT
jgi:hypothetical protein